MRRKALVAVLAAALMAAALPAGAAIHEITGATCNGSGVDAPGQDPVFGVALTKQPRNALRALQATGFIASIDTTAGDGDDVKPIWDFDVPSSKFVTSDIVFIVPNFFGPGVDLILDPLPVPDPNFAAHANCENFPTP